MYSRKHFGQVGIEDAPIETVSNRYGSAITNENVSQKTKHRFSFIYLSSFDSAHQKDIINNY